MTMTRARIRGRRRPMAIATGIAAAAILAAGCGISGGSSGGGGELVVSRQNTEGPASGDGLSRGSRVRLAWRPEQAFTIPSGEGT